MLGINSRLISVICTISFLLPGSVLAEEEATIREEWMAIKSYPFSDPDPVPSVGRYYPYSNIDGFSNNSESRRWKRITLENSFIKVFVMPELGGKVWGAVEKSTGKSFVYTNDVVKFRDVALRGPWTSGGIEFNFGTLGHSPSTSAPVNYKTNQHPDGSVSVTVSEYDWPSRTRWSVDIILPTDTAYFETRAKWFNSTQLWTSYYHWTNAAAKADGNLKFLYSGSYHIDHEGIAADWPKDGERDLSYYEQNNFGSYKSYHVVNSASEFFGGYWADDKFGFGHWSPFDEKPGRKIWIWGLSDQGMIWEDLLTDKSGQYVEWQAGKLINQALPASSKTPFKHKQFAPNDTDVSSEYWFPIMSTSGGVDASPYATLNARVANDSWIISVSPNRDFSDHLIVTSNGERVFDEAVNFKTLQVSEFRIAFDLGKTYRITLPTAGLEYDSSDPGKIVDRPLASQKVFQWDTAYGEYVSGLEAESQRDLTAAAQFYRKSLNKTSDFLPAKSKLALLEYKMGHYELARELANEVLSQNTYDGVANYVYGLASAVLGEDANSVTALSLAAADVSLRSPGYLALAKHYMRKRNYERALSFVQKSLSFNSQSISANMLEASLHRTMGAKHAAEQSLAKVASLDAAHPFILMEQYLAAPSKTTATALNKGINGEVELPHEVYLELGIAYAEIGLQADAILALESAPTNPIVQFWLAQLYEKTGQKKQSKTAGVLAEEASPDRVFPFRRETAQVLETILERKYTWKSAYYLALIYRHMGRQNDAFDLLSQAGDTPDFAPFYVVRASLNTELAGVTGSGVEADLLRAFKLGPDNWRFAQRVSAYYLDSEDHKAALAYARRAKELNGSGSVVANTLVNILIKTGAYEEALMELASQTFLPVEGETESRDLFYIAAISQALDSLAKGESSRALEYANRAKKWPKNLGVGRPYDVDERLSDFIIAQAYDQLDNEKLAQKYYQRVSQYNNADVSDNSWNTVLQLMVAQYFQNNKLLSQISSLNEKSEPSLLKDTIFAILSDVPRQWPSSLQDQKYEIETLTPAFFELLERSSTALLGEL